MTLKNVFAVLSIDPGSTFGYAKSVVTFSGKSLSMRVADHGTIDLDMLANRAMRASPNTVLDKHRVKMSIYEKTLQRLTTMVNFDVYCVEDIFMQTKFVNSFRSLVIYTEILERVVNTDRKQILHRISSTMVKKYIANYGHADKLAVQEAIRNNDRIEVVHPEGLTQHSSDAIAIGYAMVTRIMDSV